MAEPSRPGDIGAGSSTHHRQPRRACRLRRAGAADQFALVDDLDAVVAEQVPQAFQQGIGGFDAPGFTEAQAAFDAWSQVVDAQRQAIVGAIGLQGLLELAQVLGAGGVSWLVP